MGGKVRLDRHFLPTLKHYLDRGWHLSGVTKKDSDGYYWFILTTGGTDGS